MNTAEIKELSLEEMRKKVAALKRELFNLRFQHEIGQLENPKKMGHVKRDIARIKTIIRQQL